MIPLQKLKEFVDLFFTGLRAVIVRMPNGGIRLQKFHGKCPAASQSIYQSASRRLDHSHRESCTLGRRLACERFKLAGKLQTGFSVDHGLAGQL
jgi:hypothetical protein